MATTHIDSTLAVSLSLPPCTTLPPLPHGHAERASETAEGSGPRIDGLAHKLKGG